MTSINGVFGRARPIIPAGESPVPAVKSWLSQFVFIQLIFGEDYHRIDRVRVIEL